MAAGKKKTSSKKQAGKAGWNETLKQALANKRPPGGFPTPSKPRDSVVQKVKKNAF